MPSPYLEQNKQLLADLSKVATRLDEAYGNDINTLRLRGSLNVLMNANEKINEKEAFAKMVLLNVADALTNFGNTIESPKEKEQTIEEWTLSKTEGYDSMYGGVVQPPQDTSGYAYANYRSALGEENTLKINAARKIKLSEEFKALSPLSQSVVEAITKERKYESEQRNNEFDNNAKSVLKDIIREIEQIKKNVESRGANSKKTSPTRMQEIDALLKKLDVLDKKMQVNAHRVLVATALQEIQSVYDTISSIGGISNNTAKELLKVNDKAEYQDYRQFATEKVKMEVDYNAQIDIIQKIAHNCVALYKDKAGVGVSEILNELNKMHKTDVGRKAAYIAIEEIANKHYTKTSWFGTPVKRETHVQNFYFFIKERDLEGLKKLEVKTQPPAAKPPIQPKSFNPHEKF